MWIFCGLQSSRGRRVGRLKATGSAGGRHPGPVRLFEPPGAASRAQGGPGRFVRRAVPLPDRHNTKLVEALADSLGLEPGNILPGNGSTALIRLLGRALDLSCIQVVAPAFGEFSRALAIAGRHFSLFHPAGKPGFCDRRPGHGTDCGKTTHLHNHHQPHDPFGRPARHRFSGVAPGPGPEAAVLGDSGRGVH